MFQKAFLVLGSSQLLSHSRGKEPMDTEGSRLFTFTLFPFLSNPQKIHFGISSTKTLVVPHGAHKVGVQEQLHTAATFSTEARVFYTLSKTLGPEALPESHTECMLFTIFYGQEICPQGSLPCVSLLVLPFKRRCQVIKLNKTSVTMTFSSGDQKSQMHLIPGTTWQHLKLRTKGKGANFWNHWRWLQIWIVYQRKCQVYISGRAEVMLKIVSILPPPSAIRPVTLKKKKKRKNYKTNHRDSQK